MPSNNVLLLSRETASRGANVARCTAIASWSLRSIRSRAATGDLLTLTSFGSPPIENLSNRLRC
ncbi:MAG: hypothetical protein LBQ54_03025, partial [Planctomycetaceae bacterium]|nr:hypothetical protein [Planctomycetaceae bacterium]